MRALQTSIPRQPLNARLVSSPYVLLEMLSSRARFHNGRELRACQ